MSHGQSIMALLEHRFRGDGLYILDEPEAALSPNRQLNFLARLHELVGLKSQFIIATHSPIILGYPDALIYEVSERGILRAEYEDLEHVGVTGNFLNRRGMFRTRFRGRMKKRRRATGGALSWSASLSLVHFAPAILGFVLGDAQANLVAGDLIHIGER